MIEYIPLIISCAAIGLSCYSVSKSHKPAKKTITQDDSELVLDRTYGHCVESDINEINLGVESGYLSREIYPRALECMNADRTDFVKSIMLNDLIRGYTFYSAKQTQSKSEETDLKDLMIAIHDGLLSGEIKPEIMYVVMNQLSGDYPDRMKIEALRLITGLSAEDCRKDNQ